MFDSLAEPPSIATPTWYEFYVLRRCWSLSFLMSAHLFFDYFKWKCTT
jgi:hypothetical protein